MSTILTISGSPSASARTGVLVSYVNARLVEAGHEVHTVQVRQLPTLPLLTEDLNDPQIAEAVTRILNADGIVVASPVYRAAYSGLVKALLDLLPKRALRGRAVLPLATGGSQGFLVAMDYALNPLLAGKGADHVVRGEFVLDNRIRPELGDNALDPEAALAVLAATERFTAALADVGYRRRRGTGHLRPAV
ncbi:NADPH-dependent FMN reductase [Umezawaea sp. Da 62-37]|uniref:NADPH-dependent FMN reductase n=1 Tax=Umezawaea sp. Da 62-37 TaxID=3075927 RepID=UPI0028F730FB|nr:NADPH-dependent FMN reductase [Umezawaea sp. Da 62-37]WNV82532.1 NADPH-dependent FMN reductase [Umezawaea sp. Da 62-37]